jgi:fibronectin type 3 domain-containing protein
VLFCSVVLKAASLELSWNPNTTDADLASYNIYKASTSGAYTKGQPLAVIVKGTVTYSLLNPTDGMYYFVVTAVDTSGNESGFSNEVSIKVDLTSPVKPTGLQGVLKKS